jgi:hypothetical protein
MTRDHMGEIIARFVILSGDLVRPKNGKVLGLAIGTEENHVFVLLGEKMGWVRRIDLVCVQEPE